ncbi:MAG: acyl-CoA dehydrogenase family protein [Nitrososphaerota archaeon]|nr:acyl-CoA/acyl-ACP dehydrogenase [Aigarchaeota archaeon]MDW8076473.1 acyl-CoA dehydrogenase family protein [Nitrososphaerota archaeon]
MDFDFTEEQELFRKSVREYCQKNLASRLLDIEEGGRIPQEIIEGLASIGVLAMTVSPEKGGAGADAVTAGIAGEEIGRADVSCATAVFYLVPAAWGYIFDKYGDPELSKKVLSKVTKGRAFVGIATTEPAAGSDLANIRMTAVKKGSTYILNGEKLYTSGVKEVMELLPEGGGFLTLAKTDPSKGARGMSLFYVPIKEVSGEVSVTYLKEMGRKGISTGGFSLKDVEIPEENMVGPENRGFYICMEGFDFARSIISVVCCGAAMAALEMVMDYIKQRNVFGNPLAKYEGVQFKLAENYAKLDAVRLLGYRALWMFDKEQREGRFTRFEVTKAAAEAKMLAPWVAFDAINDAMQWYGAYGYMAECPLQIALRGVRSYMWAEGATEIMKIIVARELLGKEYIAYR